MTHHDCLNFARLLIMMTCATLLPLGSALAAEAQAWRATEVQGEVTVQQGEAPPAALMEGRGLEPGDGVATAAAARVVLTRGASTITVGPNARMEIPAGGDDGVRTRIVQAMGSLLFRVEKRASQHFEVDTPYLAAVVKGTTFTVSVDEGTSAVHVVDGAVEVKALATGQVGMVKPGYTAVVSARKGRGLSIIGGKPDASRKAPGAGDGDANGELDEAEPADGAGGRAAAPGQVKRLHAAVGQASVDVAATSKGFVRNASLGNADHGRADAASSSAGKGKAKGLSKEKSNNGKSDNGKSASSPGGAKASGGNPGGGKAVGLAKSSPAGSSTVTSQNRANQGKLLAALAKAREEARKRRQNVGGGGEIGDDDDDDDD